MLRHTLVFLLCLLALPLPAQIVNNHFESSQESVKRQQEAEMEHWQQAQQMQQWQAAPPPDPRAEELRIQKALDAMRDDVARRRDYWGAAVLDLPTGTWYLGRWQASSAHALSTAASGCKGDGCRALAMLRNTCIAAASSDQGALVWADHVDPKNAQKAAERACAATGGRCAPEPELMVCSGYRYLADRIKGWRPGRAAIPDAEIRWNTALREMLALPAKARVAAAKQKPPVPARVWTAMARNPEGRVASTTDFTADSARHRILAMCGDNCDMVALTDRPLCYANGYGRIGATTIVPVVATGDTLDAAKTAFAAECKRKGTAACEPFAAECVSL